MIDSRKQESCARKSKCIECSGYNRGYHLLKRFWKMAKLENGEIGKWRNWKMAKLENGEIGKWRNWKMGVPADDFEFC